MKRLLLLTFMLLTIVNSPLTAFAQPAKDIPVFIDGLSVPFDVKPIIQDGRTLVPFRALTESLNVKVTWDGTTQTIRAEDTQASISLQIGNKIANHNGTQITLDVPPQIINGRTLIPLRFFSEAFACKVTWQDTTNSILIASPPRDMTTIGFYALGDQQTSSWKNLFGKAFPETGVGNTDVVRVLALGWYSLDQEGTLLTKSRTGWQRPEDYEKVLETAREYNLKTQMVIHLTDKDNLIFNLLTNQSASTKAISEIVAEAKSYQGVNLDFEGLGWQDKGERLTLVRDSFTDFVTLLSQQLKEANLELTLTLHAPNSAYQGYDYQKLGQAADEIIVMAYDYGSKPEPVSLVTQAVITAKNAVPAEKLILGISAPSETPDSLLTKVGIAKRYNLKGIALWRLGLISTDMWDSLRSTVQSSQSDKPQ